MNRDEIDRVMGGSKKSVADALAELQRQGRVVKIFGQRHGVAFVARVCAFSGAVLAPEPRRRGPAASHYYWAGDRLAHALMAWGSA